MSQFWYKKGAEKGDGLSMDRNARDYEFRLKDKNEARKWYRKAVVFGCREAKEKLDRLDNEK